MSFLIAILMGSSASAESGPDQIADAYMNGIIAGKVSTAFDTLMTHSKVDELRPGDIALVKSQVEQAIDSYGAPSAFESIASKKYGSSLARLIYVTKHADVPLVWNFYFYRASDGWKLINFDFNDQFLMLE